MPTTYTPNASNDPATYTLPSDLDNATAESVAAPFRALADKAAHAYQVFAQLNAPVNTFNGQIKVATLNPADHAFEVLGAGRWRPMMVGHCGFTFGGEETELRFYVNDPTAGGGGYTGAIVANAVYDTIWKQQANFLPSIALLMRGTGFDFSYMPSGSADWTTWPQGAAEVWGKYFYALNEFRYINALTRTMYLTPSMAGGDPGVLVDASSGSADLVNVANGRAGYIGGDYAWIRIQLPVGATLTRVDIKHYQNSSVQDRFDLVTRDPNWTSPTASPTWSYVSGASAATDTSTGYKVSAITHSVTIGATTELHLLWRPVSPNERFSGAKVTWTDPGAGRNY